MCVVIAKYFDDVGWVGVKNRDRNYVPEISFKQIKKGELDILYFWDDVTQYCEGMNSAGISVVSASLMVQDDEKEITVRTKKPSKDGSKLKNALKYDDISAVVMALIKTKLPGNTIIWNAERCFLLEGCWEPGEYKARKYAYKVKEIQREETVARTNHGVWLPWAGYQRSEESEANTLSRISSESRLKIAEWIVQNAENADDMIDKLAGRYSEHPQLNAFRTTNERKKMRTTAQLMMIPSQGTMYVRPVQSHIHFNFWDMNQQDNNLWIEILSNRVLKDTNREGFKDPKMTHASE